LTGRNTITSSSLASTTVEVDLLRDEEDYSHGGLVDVLLGLGEHVNEEEETDAQLLEVKEGQYSWPFSFKLPCHAPLSMCEQNVEVLYSLTVTLDTPALPASLGQMTHTIVIGTRPLEEEVALPVDVLGNVTSNAGGSDIERQQQLQRQQQPQLPRSSAWRCFGRKANEELCSKKKELVELSLLAEEPAAFAFESARHKLALRVLVHENMSSNLQRARRVQDEVLAQKLIVRVVMEVKTRTSTEASFEKADENHEKRSARSRKGVLRFLNPCGGGKDDVCSSISCSSTNRVLIWERECEMTASEAMEGEEEANSAKLARQVEVEVPLVIDTSCIKKSLREWPRPLPTPHSDHAAAHAVKILAFSSSSPLHQATYFLEAQLGSYSTRAQIYIKPPPPPACASPQQQQNEQNAHVILAVPAMPTGRPPLRAANIAALSSSAAGASNEGGEEREREEQGGPGQRQITVPPTPQAVLAPVRVVGELMSRGPAAVLMDRGANATQQVLSTPSRHFAPLYSVNAQAATALIGTPAFSPAMAFLCTSGEEGEEAKHEEGDREWAARAHIFNEEVEEARLAVAQAQ